MRLPVRLPVHLLSRLPFRLPPSRSVRLAGVLALLGLPSWWLLAHGHGAEDTALIAPVKHGRFTVDVTTSGELQARKFVEITAPAQAQQAGAYQMKIASIVPEGTVVHEGDVVATLDRATLADKLNQVTLALQKAQAQYEQAQLDSALNLSTARENIHTLELGLEEKRLAKEESAYEAPTVQRQAQIDLERAQRALDQAKADLITKVEQAKAKMREVGADLARQRSLLQVVQQVLNGFTIRAPTSGMVIYVKDWNGRKRTTGSQISAWNPGVATLPDLSQMESVTYVNEIDVRKIQVGQPVEISLDADPTKHLTGTVTSVANVGEQRPNADAKVFAVKVTVSGADTTLRPGMTTGNAIQTYTTDNALSVPIEAVNSENGVPFVYRLSGGDVTKQEVVTGAMNDDEVVILRGLEEDDHVLLTAPKNHEAMTLQRLPESERNVPVAGGDTALRSVPPPPAPPSDTSPRPPQD